MMTTGKLRKSDLTTNTMGKVVSKRKQLQEKKKSNLGKLLMKKSR